MLSLGRATNAVEAKGRVAGAMVVAAHTPAGPARPGPTGGSGAPGGLPTWIGFDAVFVTFTFPEERPVEDGKPLTGFRLSPTKPPNYFSTRFPREAPIAWLVREQQPAAPGGKTRGKTRRETSAEGRRHACSLWADAGGARGALLARLTTVSVTEEGAEYELRDGSGALLATVAYQTRSFVRLRRPGWTVRFHGELEGPEITGRQGRAVWWCLWWPLFPVQMAVFWLTLIVTLGLGSSDGIDYPRGMWLRRNGHTIARYHRIRNALQFYADAGLDQRVAAALYYLLTSDR